MSDRKEAQTSFLETTPWANWSKAPIAQDASARSYTRLSQGTQSVILMDAPPQTGEDIRPFVQIGTLLQGMDLAPPSILKQDQNLGFLVLEDLGPRDFATTIKENPASAHELYQAAADILLHIADQPAPDLPKMNPQVAGDMVRITAEHYVQSPALAEALANGVTEMVQSFCGPAVTLALRDYHAENLIWRPQESGLKRVGLLDFQDAFIAPFSYDLASLLRDVRRDIDDNLAMSIIGHVAQETGEPTDKLALRVRCLAIQRNLRILGVFARLIRVHGKTKYAAMLPRVWRYVMEDLDHPALTDLRNLVCDGLPAPDEFKAIQ